MESNALEIALLWACMPIGILGVVSARFLSCGGHGFACLSTYLACFATIAAASLYSLSQDVTGNWLVGAGTLMLTVLAAAADHGMFARRAEEF
jgi:hypothetical protein